MAKESLREIFNNHGLTWLRDSEKDALIEAVRGHTMTVDLMARTLKHNHSLKPETLLSKMRDGTLPEQNLRPVEVDRNGDPTQAQIYDHLKKLFRVVELSENDKKLLRWAVLLPEGGLKLDYLLEALPGTLKTQPDAQIDRCWLSFDRETELVTMHPVLRLVCREELKPDDDNCGDFLNAVWGKFSRRRYDAAKYRQFAELFSRAAEQLPDTEAGWAIWAGFLWKQVGLAANARRYEEQAVRRLEETRPGSWKLATAYNNLGTTYGDLGDHRKALEYKLKDLAISEKVLPGDHPDLASSYSNVGCTYDDLGDHSKALEYKLKALAIREKVLPEDHPDLATSYANISVSYGEMGNHEKALEYDLKAIEIREKVLPPDHPALARSYNNVGCTYDELGDHSKALEYKLKALAIREKVLPEDHPNLAISYNNVGYTYGKLGDGMQGLEFYLKALAIREKVLPANHPDLLNSYNNVAIILGEQNKHREALEHKLKAFAILERTLSPEDPKLAKACNSLGMTYWKLGEKEEELKYFLKALAIREKVLPPDHSDLLSSYNNVGITYAERGDYEKALACTRKALAIAERTLPEGNPKRKQYSDRAAKYEKRLAEQNKGEG